MTANSAKLLKEVQKANKSIKSFEDGAKKAANVVKAAFAVLGVGQLAQVTLEAANSAKELQNLSRIAGVSTESFQRMAFGAQKLGIEQDKVSDILKDVNDKIGDFMATGAGPMVDFFDNIAPKVGVTAEQFKNLNSSEALQLYVSSLEKANVSQAQMTFYMEAIANDATALIPLFAKNGKLLKEQGDQAERYGGILSEVALKEFAEFNKSIQISKTRMKSLSDEISLNTVIAINDLVRGLKLLDEEANSSDLKEYQTVVRGIGLFAYGTAQTLFVLGQAAFGIAKAGAKLKELEFADAFFELQVASERAQITIDKTDKALEDYFNGIDNRKKSGSDDPLGFGNGDDDPPPPSNILAITDEQLKSKRELLEESIMSEHELLNKQQQDELNILIDSLARGQITKQQFDQIDKKRQAKHNKEMQDMNSKAAAKAFQTDKRKFDALLSGAAQHSRAMFNIHKVMAISEALLNAESAVLGAYAVGAKIGGPPLGAAYAGIAAAATAVNIAAIASSSFGGGGSSSGGAGGGAVPDVSVADDIVAANDEEETVKRVVVNVEGLDDEQFLSREALRGIIDEINEAEGSNVIIQGL
ncbi:MAG: hypothetical protein EBT12_00070 [Marivivens sp.]|nr:hypothetical protein [Marivivens sp.]